MWAVADHSADGEHGDKFAIPGLRVGRQLSCQLRTWDRCRRSGPEWSSLGDCGRWADRSIDRTKRRNGHQVASDMRPIHPKSQSKIRNLGAEPSAVVLRRGGQQAQEAATHRFLRPKPQRRAMRLIGKRDSDSRRCAASTRSRSTARAGVCPVASA